MAGNDGAQALVLRAGDSVAVLVDDVQSGQPVHLSTGDTLTARSTIRRGHKIALADVEAGGAVLKYGQLIGRAIRDIAPGQLVHTQNLRFDPDHSDDVGSLPVAPSAPASIGTFDGYRRSDGRVGTRNFLGILTSVNCSAATARMIARAVESSGLLAAHPGVDGVVALTHQSGCGLVPDSPGGRTLLRTLRGYAGHPNFGGLLVLGLGCEMIPVSALVDGLETRSDLPVRTLNIQENGGIRTTVRQALAEVEQLLPTVASARRTPVSAAELVLALKCGGSDGFSGITANPALGVASDLLIAAGGASVFGETPEIFGAEHLLISRAAGAPVRAALTARLSWWQDYVAAGSGSLDNNPSPGNKAGGLTTILEKSLGAVAKSGSAPLEHVLDYGERVPGPGLSFMDTPGYDPVSVTGFIAGGATVVVFTTGRGSVFGSAPTPSIKVSTTSALYNSMPDDIDFNCGDILTGDQTIESSGRRLYELILDVASGRKTSSEQLRLGEDEFVPWQFGAVT